MKYLSYGWSLDLLLIVCKDLMDLQILISCASEFVFRQSNYLKDIFVWTVRTPFCIVTSKYKYLASCGYLLALCHLLLSFAEPGKEMYEPKLLRKSISSHNCLTHTSSSSSVPMKVQPKSLYSRNSCRVRPSILHNILAPNAQNPTVIKPIMYVRA